MDDDDNWGNWGAEAPPSLPPRSKETATAKIGEVDIRVIKGRVCVPPSYKLHLDTTIAWTSCSNCSGWERYKDLQTATGHMTPQIKTKIQQILDRYLVKTTQSPLMVIRSMYSGNVDDFAITLLVVADWSDKTHPVVTAVGQLVIAVPVVPTVTPVTLEEATTYVKENKEGDPVPIATSTATWVMKNRWQRAATSLYSFLVQEVPQLRDINNMTVEIIANEFFFIRSSLRFPKLYLSVNMVIHGIHSDASLNDPAIVVEIKYGEADEVTWVGAIEKIEALLWQELEGASDRRMIMVHFEEQEEEADGWDDLLD
ncbi:hypothetical protein QBC38DRAFT_497999 [Podospora fimiseda]|uniref:Uncharacterized protein n=1 Tax=Podospora fimiseda TaxID=252190 RepID=A0AAN7BTS5_9PEZI|nr:hypothetical protein QBC38DRAFT_497999 [Podospora fimiseda]